MFMGIYLVYHESEFYVVTLPSLKKLYVSLIKTSPIFRRQ